MLKCQRPASPLSSSFDMHMSSPTPFNHLNTNTSMDREMKRRRTIPTPIESPCRPPMESQRRATGKRQRSVSPGPEHASSSSTAAVIPGTPVGPREMKKSRGESVVVAPVGEYSTANTLLHDLHTMHHHRLIFSTPAASPPPPPTLRMDHGTPSKTVLPPLNERPRQYPHTSNEDEEVEQHGSSTSPVADDSMNVDEVASVKERYEDTNKLLRSLFLSRRTRSQGSMSMESVE